MPAMSFSGITSRGPFYELILNEQKAQTIREPRKKPIKVGDILFMYWRQRTSILLKKESGEPHFIAMGKVTSVDRMKYRDFAYNDAMAMLDGFTDAEELQKWFGCVEKHGDKEYDVIRWKLIKA